MKTTVNRILVAVLLVLLAAAMLFVYTVFSEKPVEGSKAITIEVVGPDGSAENYTLTTEAAYLQQALEEAGITVEGIEGEFGLMVTHVNGIRADYTLDGAYWTFHVNGEYGNYGIGQQPVEDGDAFSVLYTKA